MKGKSIKVISSIIFVLILILVFSITSFADEKPIVLKYSDNDPTTGLRPGFLKEVWIPEVIKQTNGKVSIQDFWGAVLLSNSEALKGVKDGVTDMSTIMPTFYSKQLLIHQIFALFAKAPSKWENIAWVYHKAFEEIPEFKAELEAWNQKLLFVMGAMQPGFYATYPIESVDDFKGKKWRAGMVYHLQNLKRLSAIPVSIPWSDLYMSLSTGTIDGVLANYDGGDMMKFYEVAPNVLVAPTLWYPLSCIVTINLDKWNSLPRDVQEGLLEAGRIAEEKYSPVFKNAFDNIVAAQREAGCTVNFMSEEDIEKFADEDFFTGIRNLWIKEAKDEGIKDAAYYVKRLKLIIEEGIKREQ